MLAQKYLMLGKWLICLKKHFCGNVIVARKGNNIILMIENTIQVSMHIYLFA